MPQPKSSGRQTQSSSQGKSPASARAKQAPKAKAAKRTSSAASSAKAPTKPKVATKPKPNAAQKASKTSSASPPKPPPAAKKTEQKPVEDPFGVALAAVRDRLARGLVLTGERLQETIDDAASRGRLTHKDAEDLAQRLISAGRKQTEDLLVEIEQLVERSGDEIIRASRKVRKKLR